MRLEIWYAITVAVVLTGAGAMTIFAFYLKRAEQSKSKLQG